LPHIESPVEACVWHPSPFGIDWLWWRFLGRLPWLCNQPDSVGTADNYRGQHKIINYHHIAREWLHRQREPFMQR
jgi:hypothetical protein